MPPLTTVYRKDIAWRYHFLGDVIDYHEIIAKLRNGKVPLLARWLEHTMNTFGASGLAEACIRNLHIINGVQYMVSKDVSDELDRTDFAPATDFTTIPWPAGSIEMYFEDPNLPTIIVARSEDGFVYDLTTRLFGRNVQLPKWAVVKEPAIGAFMDTAHTDPPQVCTVIHNKDTWHRAVESGGHDVDRLDSPVSLNQTPEERDGLHHMLHLAMKVLAYSSIPQHKPAPFSGHTRRVGGKPGFLGRPKRPSFRVVYLPHVYRGPSASSAPTGVHRQFKGRRGHLRFLGSEFYKRMRGQWIYIPRVVVEGQTGDSSKQIFKVRKPS